MVVTKSEPYTKKEIGMKNLIVLSSMAMDLKRAAIGFNRGSFKMAERFCMEVAEREQELDLSNLKQYVRDVISGIEGIFAEKDSNRKVERLLMYSTILQNYVVSKEESVFP